MNNIPAKNFLRTSGFRRFPELNIFQTFNEEGKTLSQMSNDMKNLIQKNYLQSRKQSKKPIMN